MKLSLLQRHPAFLSDFVISLALLAAALWYSATFFNYAIPPFEDAAMLMRYADHLAHGAGIVWNPGERPVDGATDFLFMVSAAGLIKLGLPVGRAVRAIAFFSHLLTILLIYWANRRLWGTGPALAAISALYLAVGTGFAYVTAFFGTPFFALAGASTWTLGLLLTLREDPPPWLDLAFALSGLVTGLIRPEGVILSTLMLSAVLMLRGWKRSRRMLAIFIAVFLSLGGAYFLWRWHYFGYPLPNPFYKKGGGILHLDSLLSSLLNTARLCAPFWPAFVLGFRTRPTARQSLAFLTPILGFALAFVLISDEMNFGARFQYVLLPLVLLCWYPLVRELASLWPPQPAGPGRGAWVAAGVLITFGLLFYSGAQNCFLSSPQQTCFATYDADGRYDVARMLSAYRDKGYVMATSEAGLLPFYSGWYAIDTWGLNDPWIAHHGEITAEYLERYRPHLIVFHAYYSPLVPPRLSEKNLAQDWFRMTITLKDYAETHGYILAAAFGDSPYDAHYYYVRPDFEDSAAIINRIEKMKYFWPLTGKKAINYARLSTP